jgi:hypothetical protein
MFLSVWVQVNGRLSSLPPFFGCSDLPELQDLLQTWPSTPRRQALCLPGERGAGGAKELRWCT